MAQKVDLQSGVDGNQIVILPCGIRVIRVVDRVHFQHGVAVHELVQFFRAQRKGGDDFAFVEIFAAAVDHAFFHQAHDAVAQHFGVHAQIFFVCELHHHGIWNAAIANLQSRAIFNHVGHIFANGFLHGADFGQAHFQHGCIIFNQSGHLRNVHMAVAVGKWHVGVHF